MKNSPWARFIAIPAITLLGICLQSHPGSGVLAKSDAFVQSYSFMPGQSMNFTNRKFKRVEVRSTFPMRVLSGQCHEEYVVQFFCKSDQPGDIFVTDLRKKPLLGLGTPQANQITITEIKK